MNECWRIHAESLSTARKVYEYNLLQKNENPLNGTQDNHFLQCVEFMTEQTFAMTSNKKSKLRGDLCVCYSFDSTAWPKQASYLDIFLAWSTKFEWEVLIYFGSMIT